MGIFIYLLLLKVSISCSVLNCLLCSDSSHSICKYCDKGFILTPIFLCVQDTNSISSSSKADLSDPKRFLKGKKRGSGSHHSNPSSGTSSNSGSGGIIGIIVSVIVISILLICVGVHCIRKFKKKNLNMNGIVENQVEVFPLQYQTDPANNNIQIIPAPINSEFNNKGILPTDYQESIEDIPAVGNPSICADSDAKNTSRYNEGLQEVIIIDQYSFNMFVPVVKIDEEGKYNDQNTCIICAGSLTNDDTRALPCKHAFHGKCIYDMMVIGNNKVCPSCNHQYY